MLDSGELVEGGVRTGALARVEGPVEQNEEEPEHEVEHEDMARERAFRMRRDVELIGEFRVPLLELEAEPSGDQHISECRR